MTHVDSIAQIQRQLKDLLSAAQVLTGGLHDPEKKYHLEKVTLWLAFATKATGFAVGARAHLIEDVPCSGGWAGDAHNLLAKKEGVVEDIDITEEGVIRILFTPDHQTWIPPETYGSQGIVKGVPQPLKSPHCFWLSARHLKPGPLPSNA
jgi:hypothetical protein